LIDKPDIDIWYNHTYATYFNILKVIEKLGQDIRVIKNEKTPNPRNSFFKCRLDSFTLEILPEIKAPIKFYDATKKKVTVDFYQNQFILLTVSI
jgi:hypothetical protein